MAKIVGDRTLVATMAHEVPIPPLDNAMVPVMSMHPITSEQVHHKRARLVTMARTTTSPNTEPVRQGSSLVRHRMALLETGVVEDTARISGTDIGAIGLAGQMPISVSRFTSSIRL